MKLISVNAGVPRTLEWKGKLVTTGIFKEPVAGRVAVRRLNLEGDRQADLAVHGGPDKALYAYPAEHYAFWQRELPDTPLGWGSFGENFTTQGLLEETVHIGDRFGIGSAVVMVTSPRLPCYKLGLRFGRDDMVKRFLRSGRTGFYLSVAEEGEAAAGDAIEPLARDENQVAVADITRLYLSKNGPLDLLLRAVKVPALPASWRDYFRERIGQA